jgi:hypothetical protein
VNFRLRSAMLFRVMLLWTAAVTAAPGQQSVSPEAILGFEDLSVWQIQVNAAVNTSVALSGVRTQGSSAYSVTNPANETKLTSAPLSSGSTPLAGIGVAGSSFAVDIRFPASTYPAALSLFVISASRGLSRVPLGRVDLAKFRPGIFQTVAFPITDQVRTALADAAYSDLKIELDLTAPEQKGEYLFDNFRIRSTQAVMTTAATRPPDGYGGSVDLDVLGGAGPVEKTFEVGPVQVPSQFHLNDGTAGPTVQLDLGYSAGSIVATCQYQPDPADQTRTSYVFISCTGGPQPGDIVGASWARLEILNGAPPQRIRAQLARRPAGDQVGSNIIPPMPTFWGDAESCVVAPISGSVISQSPSCTAALAQASKIVDDYFKTATAANPAPGWVVAPVPEFAKRHGDGAPQGVSGAGGGILPSAAQGRSGLRSLIAPRSASTTSIPLVNEEGHLNDGGDFDAYWKLTGGLDNTNYPGTDRGTTDFDADFSTHGVLFGVDVKVLDVAVSAKSDTGQTVPSHLDPSSSAEAHLYVFGLEYPCPDCHADAGGSFNKNLPVFSQQYSLPPIRFWVFAIQLGVNAEAGLNLEGGVSAKGLNLTATPQGTIGAHLFGGVDIVAISGGLDATVDLLKTRLPVAAQAGWYLDPTPASCSATISGSVDSDLTIASGGGHVDLVATFGVCPLCDDYSQTIFSWPPLYEKTVPVFHQTLNVARFELPASLCTKPLDVTIAKPVGTAYGGKWNRLEGKAFSPNTNNQFPTELTCSNSNFTWSSNTPGDVISGSGCDTYISFANTPHQSVITLTVNHSLTDANGRTLTESGTGTSTVTVTPLAPGVHIQSILDLDSSLELGIDQSPVRLPSAPAVDGYLLTGYLQPPDGVDQTDLIYRWTVTRGDGTTQNITCGPAYLQGCIVGGLGYDHLQTFWNPTDTAPYDYTITLTAISKATGEDLSHESVTIIFHSLQ